MSPTRTSTEKWLHALIHHHDTQPGISWHHWQSIDRPQLEDTKSAENAENLLNLQLKSYDCRSP